MLLKERRDLIRAHEWIRLFTDRKLCGQNEHGVWWDDVKGSTHLRVWADVDGDLNRDLLNEFKKYTKKLTDPDRR